ncbi:MAG: hypothetical protein CMF39_00585 [Legionellaceae bacterium]|mgnify:CR=1 FL=1|nr:hypothetical protein [Legionellaceae bacterium]|tara:strand:+ start:349 stop:750 length:402 start_codon:yes stop_codon:yes gene_type:complete
MTSLKKALLVSAISIASVATASATYGFGWHHRSNQGQDVVRQVPKQLTPTQRANLVKAVQQAMVAGGQLEARMIQAALKKYAGVDANVRVTDQTGRVYVDTANPSTVGHLARNTRRPGEKFAGNAIGISAKSK